jgi:peptidoglycan/xylan/chitin deacetylase (PgdA/CDA1 family)
VNPEEASSQWVSVKAGGTEGFVPRKDLVLYDKRKKLIALTYDDGPDAWGTRRVLNAFQRTHTKGTFFVLGNRINKDTAPLLKRATRLGCEIGNHSWNHAYLPGMRRKNLARQLGRTDYKLRKITGHRPRLVRPPYGAFDRRVKKIAGRPLILWSVDTEDWKYRKTNRLVKYVRIHKRNGAVILMHDIHPSTVRAAEPIIRHLKASGYQLVTVSELAAIRGEKLGVGTVYIGK